MKKLSSLASTILFILFASPIQAHNGEMCNYELDYDLTVQDSAITFSNDSNTNIEIDQDNNLYVNKQKQSLNNEQQKLIDNYADGVRVLIPEITEIAIEGVNLGVQAAGMALGALLGEGDPDFIRFNSKIEDLANTITINLDANNFSSSRIEDAFDDDFEDELESVVEEAVTEITPRLMAKVVAAAMSGDEHQISSIEDRADSIEDEIKNVIEPQAEALEARADELCVSIEDLNTLENKLVESGLEMMDLIEEENSSHRHNSNKKRFKFDLGD